MTIYSDLVSEYGGHSVGYAVALSAAFWVLFIWRYVSGRPDRATGAKILDIIFMFFFIALFIAYLFAGIYIGDTMFGSTAIGACIGIGAFWAMFEFLAFLKKKRAKI